VSHRATPLLVLVVAFGACGGHRYATLSHAGDEHDEGAGLLARASQRLYTDEPVIGASDPAAPQATTAAGSDAFGGTTYAAWQLQWTYTTPNRVPSYTVASGLTGSVAGVVTWAGAMPGKLATACGTIPNPSLRVSTDHALGGVIVYIAKVATGRPLPYYARPLDVGGLVAKHGCLLEPAAQVVTPLPAGLDIEGDAAPAQLRVTAASGTATGYALEAGGLVRVPLEAGVTEVATDDGKVAHAWAVAVSTPYYAVTDDAGRYRIDELAPGTYDVTFWQAPIAHAGADGAITYGAPIVLHRTVQVSARGTAALHVALSGR
jgi:hypothetical protein